MSSLSELKSLLDRRKGEMTSVKKALEIVQFSLVNSKKKLKRLSKATTIVQTVAKATQEELEYHISELVSLGMDTVFPRDPYKLNVDFVLRRNKTETDLTFSRKDSKEKVDPLSASGGGTVDVASFALRLSLWSINAKKSRPVFILDEPFKHIKGREANEAVLKLLGEISKKLGIQIIMVGDERIDRDTIVENTDKVFEISKKREISNATVSR